jgi:hypothetical protein
MLEDVLECFCRHYFVCKAQKVGFYELQYCEIEANSVICKFKITLIQDDPVVKIIRFWITFYNIMYIKKLQKYYFTVIVSQNIAFVLLIKKNLKRTLK